MGARPPPPDSATSFLGITAFRSVLDFGCFNVRFSIYNAAQALCLQGFDKLQAAISPG